MQGLEFAAHDYENILQNIVGVEWPDHSGNVTPERVLNVWSIMVTAHNIGDVHLVAEVLVGAILSVLTNVLVVLGLSLFINRMTSKILKAIDLSSKQ